MFINKKLTKFLNNCKYYGFLLTKILFLFFGVWLVEYSIFENNVSAYWITALIMYIIYNLATPILRSYFNWTQIHFFNLLLMWNLFFITVCLFTLVWIKNVFYVFGGVWLSNTSFSILNGTYFYLDFYSLVFLLLVITISLYVLPYSSRYLNNEPTNKRFYFLINGFIAGMIILVSSNHLITLILGWELIGWFSFFLIANYTTSVKSQIASLKVMSFNKFSDSCIFLFACLNLLNQNSHITENWLMWESLTNIFIQNSNNNTYQWVLIAVLLASFVKSAHFGLHLWLPDSMEAPIPASALIHSATLVSAGIYLIGRLSNVIHCYPNLHDFILTWGAVTAFIGALVGSYQTDFKKTLAYSTISHCGFLMILALNVDKSYLYLYLVVHGLLKSFSFVLGGDIILSSNNYQDWRKSGLYLIKSKIKFILLVLSVSGLAGLPFGMGFVGKNTFLLHNVLAGQFGNVFALFFIISASLLGLLYTFRLTSFVFYSRNSSLYNKNYLLAATSINQVNVTDIQTKKYYNQKNIYWLFFFYIIFIYILTLTILFNINDFDKVGIYTHDLFLTTNALINQINTYAPLNNVVLVYVNVYVLLLSILVVKFGKKLNFKISHILLLFVLSNTLWFIL